MIERTDAAELPAAPARPARSPRGEQYVVLYRPGPAWVAGRPVAEQPLGPHRAYVQALLDEGRVAFAGPFLDDSGGVAVLAVRDRAEAERTLAADPAVVSGVMVGELRPYYPVVDGGRPSPARAAGAHDAVHDAGADRTARNAEAVRRLYAAVERRDAEAVWQVHHPAVVIHEAPSLPYGGEYHGPDGVRRQAAGYVAAWDPLQDEADRQLAPEVIADGDVVAVVWQQRARSPATGEVLDQPAVSVHRLAEGRIVESRMFHFDTHALREFLRSSRGAAEDVASSERALNAMIVAGEYAAAMERFYADDVVMCEAGGPETAGRVANRAREAALLRALARIEARLLGGAVDGASAYSEWEYRLEFPSGRALEYRQVAARVWRGGRVARETFYHAPFPEWMAEEINAASAR